MAEMIEFDEKSIRDAWWENWKQSDYSWAQLRSHKLESISQFGEQNLQEYWRTDLKNGQRRSDSQLLENGELKRYEGKLWHIVHLPLEAKSTFTQKENDLLTTLISERLQSSRDLNHTWTDEEEGVLGQAQFQGVVIHVPIDFVELVGKRTFSMCAPQSYWGDRTTFADAIISDYVDLSDVLFDDFVSLERATVNGHLALYRSAFMSVVVMNDVEFCESLEAHNAVFAFGLKMERSKFRFRADFRNSKFLYMTSFERTEFCEYAIFDNAEFHAATNFTHTVWHSEAWFHEAKLHSNTSFDRARFTEVNRNILYINGVFWFLVIALCMLIASSQSLPITVANLSILGTSLLLLGWIVVRPLIELPYRYGFRWHALSLFFPHDTRLERHARHFRMLAIASDKSRNREDLKKFNTLEFKAARLRRSTDVFERGLSCLYDWVSGYGYSFVRPVATLLVMTYFFSLFYTEAYPVYFPRNVKATEIELASFTMPSYSGVDFAVSNVFRPFHVWSSGLPDTQSKGLSGENRLSNERERHAFKKTKIARISLKLLATCQSLLAIVVLFLLGLALRRRFSVN